MSGVVIIGGGQAGFSAAAKLRSLGYEGAISLICGEAVPPYQRPPLSKAYLLGEMEKERLFFRPENFYAEQGIELILGNRATSIDREAKSVTLSDERSLSYDTLILSTGAIPRRLPAAIGGDLYGVYTMRNLNDADGMAHEFRDGAKALIIGGGYIGLEAAAVAAKRGAAVTLVEAAERILQRVASEETSDYFRKLHSDRGVRIIEGDGLKTLIGDGGRVTAAELADGTRIEVDFVVTGIGIAPDIALAEAAGLEIENGIRTDAHCRTSDRDIYAAGDCASFPQAGGRIRLESVGNAIDMGEAVAADIMGSETPYVAKPWFWSDQYDCKLQIAGLSTGYDKIITRQGDGDEVSFWYFHGDNLIAVDAMNDPRGYMVGKRLIESGKSPDPAAIADPSTNLKLLLKG